MNIIVCIKQVPDVTEVSWDPVTGALIRKGVPSVINPCDRNALEAALQLAETAGGTVTVLSMGPGQVEESLREALGMGADQAILLTDKKFAAADTLATSYTLGLAIKKIGDYDLILCGKEAVDGMTAQVGPELAVFLDIPQMTYATGIAVEKGSVRVTQKLGNLRRVLEADFPALITVEREINTPRVPPVDLVIEAYQKEITFWDAADVKGEDDKCGLCGSPTRLKKIFRLKRLRGDVEILEGSPGDVSRMLVQKLKERCVL